MVGGGLGGGGGLAARVIMVLTKNCNTIARFTDLILRHH